MPPEMSFTDGSNVPTTTIPWTTVQRTSYTSTLTYHLWNEFVATTTASTATRITIYPIYQMNVGEAFLRSGVEPADSQWLYISMSGVENPLNGTSGDHGDWSSGWYSVGGGSPFVVNANIPRRFARHLQTYLSPLGSGSATSINAMEIVADWDRGITTQPAWSRQLHGDDVVFRGDWTRYALLRGQELVGFQVKPDNPNSADYVIVEPGFFQLGIEGLGWTTRFRYQIPSIADAADGATSPGDAYKILVTKNPTGFGGGSSDFTFTKGDKAVSGSEIVPALPSLNDIPVAVITKVHGAVIAAANVEVTAVHDGGTITADGTGLDCVLGQWLTHQAGATQVDESEKAQTGLTNGATLYVRTDAQNVPYVNAAEPISGATFHGRLVTSGGNVTSVSNRQCYIAPSSYRSRRKSVSSPWHYPSSGTIQFLGRLDGTVSGNVNSTPTTQTVTFVGGHRVISRITTCTTPGTLRLTGTSVGGDGTETGSATEDLFVNKVDDWVMSQTRWMGSSANSSSVVLSSVGGLDVALTAFRCLPWDNNGKPFHMARARLEFVPASDSASARLRLFKVPRSGALVTVFDTGAKTDFSGSGSGSADTPMVLEAWTSGGTNCDTEKRWSVPDAAICQPWEGEWIYAEAISLVHIASCRFTLEYFDLFM